MTETRSNHPRSRSLLSLSTTAMTASEISMNGGSASEMDPSSIDSASSGIGRFSDATFIAMLVVGAIVIIVCLVCAVVCYSKYQKRELRKQWLKDRAERRNRTGSGRKRTMSANAHSPDHREIEITDPFKEPRFESFDPSHP